MYLYILDNRTKSFYRCTSLPVFCYDLLPFWEKMKEQRRGVSPPFITLLKNMFKAFKAILKIFTNPGLPLVGTDPPHQTVGWWSFSCPCPSSPSFVSCFCSRRCPQAGSPWSVLAVVANEGQRSVYSVPLAWCCVRSSQAMYTQFK